MKKNKEKKLELQYTIEALEEELNDLELELSNTKAKLWEVIQVNDRLTMTYEPYRPPGDEHEGLEFYGLIDENKKLKKETNRLLENNRRLTAELIEIRTAVAEMKIAKEQPKKLFKNDRFWSFSFELWPGAWGLNYYRYDWKKYNGRSREGSVQIGPLGFNWNREPKDRKH